MDKILLKKLFLFLVLVLVLINLIYALPNNETKNYEADAKLCLNQSAIIMNELISDNFSIQRVNDSFNQANTIFELQTILKKDNKKTDFSQIIPYCNEIASVRDSALNAQYEFTALKKFYTLSFSGDVNTSTIDLLISNIQEEIKNERYEQAISLINECYNEITEFKASNTAIKLFYESTTTNIKSILYKNRYLIIGILIACLALIVIYQKTVRKKLIERKINRLNLRKSMLKKLIMETQKDFFEKKTLSEGIYSIRTKKFGELIRDIDRQIPLLMEELARFKKKNEKK